ARPRSSTPLPPPLPGRGVAGNAVVANANPPPNPRVPPAPHSHPSLACLSKAELAEKLVAIGVEAKKAKMRAEQLWRWIYHYGVTEFAAMTNVAKELRATLAGHYTLDRPEIVTQQISTD